MAKQVNEQLASFGERLAKLRKDAGYTQEELANEIGASRRQITYYETETQHPPANLLIELSKALNISTDELLGIKKIKPAAKINSRLERRMKQIENLNPKAKKQLLQLMDTFIEAEHLKKNK